MIRTFNLALCALICAPLLSNCLSHQVVHSNGGLAVVQLKDGTCFFGKGVSTCVPSDCSDTKTFLEAINAQFGAKFVNLLDAKSKVGISNASLYNKLSDQTAQVTSAGKALCHLIRLHINRVEMIPVLLPRIDSYLNLIERVALFTTIYTRKVNPTPSEEKEMAKDFRQATKRLKRQQQAKEQEILLAVAKFSDIFIKLVKVVQQHPKSQKSRKRLALVSSRNNRKNRRNRRNRPSQQDDQSPHGNRQGNQSQSSDPAQ